MIRIPQCGHFGRTRILELLYYKAVKVSGECIEKSILSHFKKLLNIRNNWYSCHIYSFLIEISSFSFLIVIERNVIHIRNYYKLLVILIIEKSLKI